VCSPTRAALMTGRYGFRTGIGTALTGNSDGLLLTETTLPQVLSGYDTSAVGKWHLGGGQDDLHPNAVGFGYFAGVMGGGLPNYEAWNKTTNGVTNSTTTYATTDTANEGILAINTMQEPWFLYMNFNAPHTPLHVPPTELCSTAFCFAPTCNNLGMNPSSPDLAKAMVEALDTELSRFLDALDQVDPDAYVIFMGDNGTAGQNNEPPFASNHAKGTVYEGGLNVPFIVRGPGVAIGESQALICSTDLFATIAELAGYDTFAEDSVSMVPIFGAPELSMRSFVYSETFTPNAPAVATRHDRAIFDGRYKLIRKLNTQPEFYDLLMDEFETNNLIPGLTPPQQQARAAMMAELVALGVN
ncbi:MAG: arylsulfatase B, partial [Planctomycetota bacterium]